MEKFIIILLCFFLSLSFYLYLQEDKESIERKPLVEEIYTADPSAHVFDGSIYIYPSHDENENATENYDGDQYRMKDYHVFKMTSIHKKPEDLGVVLKLEDVKWASRQLWAPDCVEKDGKYFFVFCARDKEGMFRIGIAKGDNPGGPFIPEDNYIKGSYSIDPCIFPDNNGKYYLVFGGIWAGQLDQYRNNEWSADNKAPRGKAEALNPKIALMKDNLLELAEEPRDLAIVDENGSPLLAKDEDRRFFEAAWLFRKDNTYYLAYSTGTTHLICYATSENVYGPYTYRGVILTPVLGWTSHISILEFKNKWYLFYHDSELSGGVNYKRNIKFTSLTFKDDGSIETINGS